MTRREKVKMAILTAALLFIVLALLGVPQRWWNRITERPPGPIATFVCTNTRCGTAFEAEVREGVEVRCPECKWRATPAEASQAHP